MDVMSEDSTANWRFTGFYGEPEASRRRTVWERFVGLSRQSDAPWLCTGDFNEILTQQEKTGTMRPTWKMEDFCKALMQSDLCDLCFRAVRYTWCNRRQTPNIVWARLDQGCGNPRWCERHPDTTVTHKVVSYADHVMLHVQWRGKEENRGRRTNQFRFDARWLQSEECQLIVESAWQRPVCQDPNTWNTRSWEAGPLDIDRHAEMDRVQTAIEDHQGREMLKWKQLSKAHWLRDGDNNTRFFHSQASNRCRQNTILRLRDEEGVWKERDEDIQNILLWYFREIFTSHSPPNTELNEVLLLMQPRITPEINHNLAKLFTVAEVKQSIFGMFPFKSPSPDGMPLVFFQKFWSTVGVDVTCATLRILNDHVLLHKMNYTHIVLISKCESPKTMAQLRPISLYDVIVKATSKCVANRLKPMLDCIISQSQSVFIQGRLITDNVLRALELNHHLQSSHRSNGSNVSIKLDMRKAYDMVEWSFLRGVLLRLGFNHRFVALIMLLVTTVSYSITLNGDHFGYFRPEHGIHQGVPLSPYLFIFCAEVFSCLIQDAEHRERLTGVAVAVARQAPRVSHLLFADDTLVFCEATAEQISEVKRILRLYSRASGQEINMHKLSMVVSGGVPGPIRHLLGVKVVPRHDKYLGLPAMGCQS
ncbi:UNVERIFIED_CONTAM: hypothetical protein Slati_2115900 [Sesamum latifolium]|uniref:Reverse transcriptase domain-containing protein n=1 Tax=Sesamum latifolium TaxID=2727402 RepID=A0AAW2WQF5_9LAMI